MDLNWIINHLFEIVLGGGAAGVAFGPELWKKFLAWRASKKPATTLEGIESVGVGTLAEYHKAIAIHCKLVGDKEALAACDRISPTLFHDPDVKTVVVAAEQ